MWVLRPREPRSRGLLYEEIVQFYGGLCIYGLCTRYSPRSHRPVTHHSGGRHFVGNDWPISLLETSDIIKALNPQPPLCAGDGGGLYIFGATLCLAYNRHIVHLCWAQVVCLENNQNGAQVTTKMYNL